MPRSNRHFADTQRVGRYLSSPFVQTLACLKLGLTIDQLESIVGRYQRGKHKDKLKGCLVWTKALNGGWIHGIGVVPPNYTYGYHIVDSMGVVIHGSDNATVNAADALAERQQPMIDEAVQAEQARLDGLKSSNQVYYERMADLLGEVFTSHVEQTNENEHPEVFARRINEWVFANLQSIAEAQQTKQQISV